MWVWRFVLIRNTSGGGMSPDIVLLRGERVRVQGKDLGSAEHLVEEQQPSAETPL